MSEDVSFQPGDMCEHGILTGWGCPACIETKLAALRARLETAEGLLRQWSPNGWDNQWVEDVNAYLSTPPAAEKKEEG